MYLVGMAPKALSKQKKLNEIKAFNYAKLSMLYLDLQHIIYQMK